MNIRVRVHLSRNPSNSGERDSIAPPIKRLYGPSKGEIYLKPGITRMQQNLAYWQTYWQSMGWLFLVICCLTLINCFVITTTRLDKKV